MNSSTANHLAGCLDEESAKTVKDVIEKLGKKPVAVFETSEIFTYQESCPDGEVKWESGGYNKLVSTGQLEKALQQGYEVYVASTRSELGPHDEWWVRLVGEDHIFLSDAKRGSPAGNGWHKLYEALGLEWPLEGDGTPEFWTAARYYLEKDGVKLGSSFRRR